MPGDTPDWLPDPSGGVDIVVKQANFAFSGGSPNFFSTTIDTGKSYQALLCSLVPRDHSGEYTILINVSDPSGNGYWSRTYKRSLVALTGAQVIFPAPCTAGGSVLFEVTGPVGATTFTLLVSGVVSDATGLLVPLRADARPYPVGANPFHGTNTGGETLIAAPGAGKRILLAGGSLLVQSPAAGNAFLQWNATVGGAAYHPAQVAVGTASDTAVNVPIPPQGILLDDNTALTTTTGGGPSAVSSDGTYDIVS